MCMWHQMVITTTDKLINLSRISIRRDFIPLKNMFYFDDIRPENYRFLNYYEYRSRQPDFTYSFQKESHRLKTHLERLMSNSSDEIKEGATQMYKIYKVKFLFIFLLLFSEGGCARHLSGLYFALAYLVTCRLPHIVVMTFEGRNPHNYGSIFVLLTLWSSCPLCLPQDVLLTTFE